MVDLSNQASFDRTLLIESELCCSLLQRPVYSVNSTAAGPEGIFPPGNFSGLCWEKTEGFALTSAIRYCDSLYKSFIPFFGSASVILHDKLTLGKESDSIRDFNCRVGQIIPKNSCNPKWVNGGDWRIYLNPNLSLCHCFSFRWMYSKTVW